MYYVLLLAEICMQTNSFPIMGTKYIIVKLNSCDLFLSKARGKRSTKITIYIFQSFRPQFPHSRLDQSTP